MPLHRHGDRVVCHSLHEDQAGMALYHILQRWRFLRTNFRCVHTDVHIKSTLAIPLFIFSAAHRQGIHTY
jgi:hypothetical protein